MLAASDCVWWASRALVVVRSGMGLGDDDDDDDDDEEEEDDDDNDEEGCVVLAAPAAAWAFCMLRSCRRAESGWDGDGVTRGWPRPRPRSVGRSHLHPSVSSPA